LLTSFLFDNQNFSPDKNGNASLIDGGSVDSKDVVKLVGGESSSNIDNDRKEPDDDVPLVEIEMKQFNASDNNDDIDDNNNNNSSNSDQINNGSVKKSIQRKHVSYPLENFLAMGFDADMVDVSCAVCGAIHQEYLIDMRVVCSVCRKYIIAMPMLAWNVCWAAASRRSSAIRSTMPTMQPTLPMSAHHYHRRHHHMAIIIITIIIIMMMITTAIVLTTVSLASSARRRWPPTSRLAANRRVNAPQRPMYCLR
jgi:hypothetical protein